MILGFSSPLIKKRRIIKNCEHSAISLSIDFFRSFLNFSNKKYMHMIKFENVSLCYEKSDKQFGHRHTAKVDSVLRVSSLGCNTHEFILSRLLNQSRSLLEIFTLSTCDRVKLSAIVIMIDDKQEATCSLYSGPADGRITVRGWWQLEREALPAPSKMCPPSLILGNFWW